MNLMPTNNLFLSGKKYLKKTNKLIKLPLVITSSNKIVSGEILKVKKQVNLTRDKFILETLALIREKGGSKNVNLREISKRVGCAHTNAYNYFDGFEGFGFVCGCVVGLISFILC